LQSQLASIGSDSSLRTEISEVRFDKEALESKLRKFAAHCQRLEDDKAGTIDALRSCNIDLEYEGGINEAIISLCDKLASKPGCKSNTETERLQRENRTLQSKIEILAQSEETVAAKVADYQKEIQELKRTMKDANDDASGDKSEMGRKLRFLEQENLQLMLDVKSTKKQLQVAREELEMLRMNAVENPTMDFGAVDLGKSDTIELSEMVKSGQKVSSAATSNENKRSRNSADSSVPNKSVTTPAKKRTRASKAALVESTNKIDKENGSIPGTKRQRLVLPKSDTKSRNVAVPGLGEAAVQDSENTGEECKQS
jgi:hypothetical protein